MSGHAHDGSRTVIRKNIIRKPYGYVFPVHGIYSIAPGKYACLFLILQTVNITPVRSIFYVVLDRLAGLIRGK